MYFDKRLEWIPILGSGWSRPPSRRRPRLCGYCPSSTSIWPRSQTRRGAAPLSADLRQQTAGAPEAEDRGGRARATGSPNIPLDGSPKIWYTEWAEAQTPPRGSGEGGGQRRIPFVPAPRAGGGLLRPGGFSFKEVAAGDGPGEAGGEGRFSRTRGPLGWNRTSSRECTKFLVGGGLGAAHLGWAGLRLRHRPAEARRRRGG